MIQFISGVCAHSAGNPVSAPAKSRPNQPLGKCNYYSFTFGSREKIRIGGQKFTQFSQFLKTSSYIRHYRFNGSHLETKANFKIQHTYTHRFAYTN